MNLPSCYIYYRFSRSDTKTTLFVKYVDGLLQWARPYPTPTESDQKAAVPLVVPISIVGHDKMFDMMPDDIEIEVIMPNEEMRKTFGEE